ncbi:MAG: hypothetical protein MUO43_11875 [Desulfobacterales bacterium]|nr:hypothetical protein [Desulfobacterales bacterium]
MAGNSKTSAPSLFNMRKSGLTSGLAGGTRMCLPVKGSSLDAIIFLYHK